jgi:DNA-binding transcriptional LysR family regulator
MMEIRRLRLLHALAGHGTISAAAEALHLTGPAVSQQLATLEREVGIPLVERHGRRLKLTDAGRILVAHTDVLLDQLAAAESDLQALRTEITGTVRIGAFSSATQTFVADAWATMTAEHGERLQLRLFSMEPGDAVVALARGEIELAVAYSYDLLPFAVPPSCEQYDLLDDPVLVALPESYGERPGPVDLSTLSDVPWMSVTGDTSCHEMLQRACGLAGFVPRLIAQCDNYPPVLALIAAGAGVTLLPRLSAAPVPSGVVLSTLQHEINRHVFAVTRHGGERQPAVGVVLDHLRRAADRVGSSAPA